MDPPVINKHKIDTTSSFVAHLVQNLNLFRTAAILDLGNLGGPDIPNHKCKYSYGFPIARKGKIDIKFVFVSHLAQKL